MRDKLPKLSSLIVPSFLTIGRKVRIPRTGIVLHSQYDSVLVDQDNLKKYREFVGFPNSEPLAYLYVLAQRAQTKLMLNPDFGLPIPGLVHISNKIERLEKFNLTEALDIDVIGNVPFKEEGSLLPIFKVIFRQKGIEIATCESTYLVKRKSKRKSNASSRSEDLLEPNYTTQWKITNMMGKEYASASGDKNPIHTSSLFAKILGFKGTILHGWCSVGKIIQHLERIKNHKYNSIEVYFLAPVYIPGEVELRCYNEGQKEVKFQLWDIKWTKLLIEGVLKN